MVRREYYPRNTENPMRLPRPRSLLPLVLLLNAALMAAQAERFFALRQAWQDHWMVRASLQRFECE